MTIIDEMNDSDKNNTIVFVEFLEFVARLGQIVFIKNKTMMLYDKVIDIMHKMFELIPAEVIIPEYEYHVDSETDDEEYQL
jgi:hypothetical protein